VQIMGDIVQVKVGEHLPDCRLLLRPDGTVEPHAIIHDPIRLHLVLGADVSPEHEQAIIDASSDADDDTSRRLWGWWTMRGAPGWMMCQLLLRPGQRQFPVLYWHGKPCPCCADTYQQLAAAYVADLQRHPSRGLPARLVVVGRGHRVLMVSRVECHNAIARQWLAVLADRTAIGQTSGGGPLQHFCGQSDLTSDPERWLLEHGWIESPQQMRLRRKRLRARQRQMRGTR